MILINASQLTGNKFLILLKPANLAAILSFHTAKNQVSVKKYTFSNILKKRKDKKKILSRRFLQLQEDWNDKKKNFSDSNSSCYLFTSTVLKVNVK